MEELIKALSEIKRYEIDAANMGGDSWLAVEESKDGDYIKFEDLELILKQFKQK